ncbi:YtxH domain-containing protein [Anaerophilus nitritogenes]|uniref:YtxH domain-containing protein n=1 Tax=Anaerophilus nitritogenes TaxID=2498136 RepID=UPI00101E206F|nr:YtxH domain-containing protein [Anaerophilus nitritogenes]
MKLLKQLQAKKELEKRKKFAKGMALGSLVGTIVGSAAGILLAPDSGRNTRKKIKDQAGEVKYQLDNNIEKLKDNISQSVENKKMDMKQAVEKIRTIKDVTAEVATSEEKSEN